MSLTPVDADLILTDDLSSKKRYAEAATVLLDYAGDVRQAVIAYVEGNLFADARRVVSPIHFLPSSGEGLIGDLFWTRFLSVLCRNSWGRSFTLARSRPNRNLRKIWAR